MRFGEMEKVPDNCNSINILINKTNTKYESSNLKMYLEGW